MQLTTYKTTSFARVWKAFAPTAEILFQERMLSQAVLWLMAGFGSGFRDQAVLTGLPSERAAGWKEWAPQ